MAVDLLALVGATACGKSSLAMALSKELSLEIIAADSRTVYRGLDIGTAKPSIADQKAVKHHLLDVVDPIEQSFNVAQFQKLALSAIDDIRQRGRLPLLVGGSGLYIDSVLFGYRFGSDSDGLPALRQSLQSLTIEQLQQEVVKKGIPLPNNRRNRRYLTRALERGRAPGSAQGWSKQTLAVGLRHSRAVLKERIEQRLQDMLDQGLLSEAEQALRNLPAESEALKSNIYIALKPYFAGQVKLQEACRDFVRRDLGLAKKQITWFKRHPQIVWFSDVDQASKYILQSCRHFRQKS